MKTVTATVHTRLLNPPEGAVARFSVRRELQFADDEHVTVDTVITRLGIVRGQVGIILIGGRPGRDSETLDDGADIGLYPVFGGG